MHEYQFTRKVINIEFGVVTADSEEEARKLIENEDYDDIIDVYGTDEPKEILTVECTD